VCGITGIFAFSGVADPHTLNRMLHQLGHRGPDDRGVFVEPDGGCALGHTRLSVIDLSPMGKQPMCNEDATVWITFNGEIYNSPKLRQELIAKGHVFKSQSDTEVIIHQYEEVGAAVPQYLDGMFAVAIYDQRNGKLLLFRDRLGKKPLYYCVVGDSLIFASELRAILSHPQVGRDLNLDALGQYLAFRATAGSGTLLQGVAKIEPGSAMTVAKSGQTTSTRFWTPFARNRNETRTYADAVDAVRRDLRAAVSKRLLADVPISCFLSGGLDSSIIVGLMAEQSAGRIDTFTVRWSGYEDYNEDGYAELVSRKFTTDHHIVSLEKSTALEYLQSDEFVLDEPLADSVSVPLHFLAVAVRQAGLKVVMVGEGSDELFLGYESRLQALDGFLHGWRYLLSLPLPLRRLVKRITDVRVLENVLGPRHKRRIDKAANDEEVFLGGSASYVEEELARLLSNRQLTALADPQTVLRRLAGNVPKNGLTETFVRKMLNLDLSLRLPELLLARIDRLTMRQSVEARAPFMDPSLVESAAMMPYEFKVGPDGGKRVLKDAFSDLLPDTIIQRRKQIFGVPMVDWIRVDLYGYVEHSIMHSGLRRRELFDYDYVASLLARHRAGAADNVVKIWTLFVLSRWFDRWIVH